MPSPDNHSIKLVNGELVEQPAAESTPSRNDNVKMVKQLLAKVLHHHAACRNAALSIANHAAAAGNYLCAIKELNPGHWQKMFDDHAATELGLSYTSALRYMRLARNVKRVCDQVRLDEPRFAEYSDEEVLTTMSLREAMRTVSALDSGDETGDGGMKKKIVATTTDTELLRSIHSLLTLDFVVTDRLAQDIAPAARFVNVDVAFENPALLRGNIFFDVADAKLPGKTLDEVLRLHAAGQIPEAILHLSVTNFVALGRPLANFCHGHLPPQSPASLKRKATILVYVAPASCVESFGSALRGLAAVFVPWQTA